MTETASQTGAAGTGRPRVIVGVDGSEPAKAALRWAVSHAQLIDGVIEAVITWNFPVSYGMTPAVLDEDFEARAAKALDQTISEVLGDDRPVPVTTAVVRGNPVHELLAAAEGAEILVVGSRGHGGFAGALLGSVSQHVVQHAPCPVVVIRGKAHD